MLWLFGIRVREEMRGNGLCSEMLRELHRIASEMGARQVSSATIPANVAMLRAFHRAGYDLARHVIIWPAWRHTYAMDEANGEARLCFGATQS